MNKIGFTTTIPVEVILAGGYTPADLNNIFITDSDPERHLRLAEEAGYPRNVCSWVKGIYSVVMERRAEFRCIVTVTEGDCSNTHALMETLQAQKVPVVTFAYPYSGNRRRLGYEMTRFIEAMGTTQEAIEQIKEQLKRLRTLLRRVDELTWKQNVVSGAENHYFLVNSSDFKGNPAEFERELVQFISEAKQRAPQTSEIRLGFVGVPPIFSDFYDQVDSLGARIVFNEVQRQFSMPYDCDGLVEQYSRYTYPYAIWGRLRDIKEAVQQRHVHGIIHYAQSFCHRQIQDVVLRKEVSVPILTLEGDRPAPLDGRTRTRLEAFVETLRGAKN